MVNDANFVACAMAVWLLSLREQGAYAMRVPLDVENGEMKPEPFIAQVGRQMDLPQRTDIWSVALTGAGLAGFATKRQIKPRKTVNYADEKVYQRKKEKESSMMNKQHLIRCAAMAAQEVHRQEQARLEEQSRVAQWKSRQLAMESDYEQKLRDGVKFLPAVPWPWISIKIVK